MTRLSLVILLLPVASGFTVTRPSFLTPLRDSTTRLYEIDVDAVTRAVTVPGEEPSPQPPAPAPAPKSEAAVTVSIPEEERLSAAPESAAPKAATPVVETPEPAAPEPAAPEPAAAVAEPEPVVTTPAPAEPKQAAAVPAVPMEAPVLPTVPDIPIPILAGGILAVFAAGTFLMREDKDAREVAQEAASSPAPPAPAVAAAVEEVVAAPTPAEADGVDISVPYDAAALLAYDAWRTEYNKGAFDASKFEKFKAKYMSVTSANMAAKKKARDAGSSELQLVALDASADE